MSTKILALIFLALILRVLLMSITLHPDLLFINIFPNLFFTDRVYEIFSYIDKNFQNPRLSYYTPLTYYSFVIFQFFYHFVSDSFGNWMSGLYQFYINQTKIAYTKDYLEHVKNAFLFKDLIKPRESKVGPFSPYS